MKYWWLAVGLTIACGETLDPSEPGNLVPPTVDEDEMLPSVALGGSRFHVRTFGDPRAPVVVFLHGGPGSSMFGLLPYAELLGDDHFLVFWDQRGAGLSRRHPPAELSWDIYVDDLEAIIDHYAGEDPVTIVAYSFGGTYAAAYANAHPERIDGLVLISPAPLSGARFADANFIGASPREGVADILWSNQVFAQDDHARMDFLLAAGLFDGLHPDFHVDPERIPAYRRFGAVAQSVLYTELGLVPPNDPPTYDYTTNLHLVDVPVLAFVGEDDALFTEAFEREQLAGFRESELVVVPGFGHDVAFAYSTVAPRVRAYLDEQ